MSAYIKYLIVFLSLCSFELLSNSEKKFIHVFFENSFGLEILNVVANVQIEYWEEDCIDIKIKGPKKAVDQLEISYLDSVVKVHPKSTKFSGLFKYERDGISITNFKTVDTNGEIFGIGILDLYLCNANGVILPLKDLPKLEVKIPFAANLIVSAEGGKWDLFEKTMTDLGRQKFNVPPLHPEIQIQANESANVSSKLPVD